MKWRLSEHRKCEQTQSMKLMRCYKGTCLVLYITWWNKVDRYAQSQPGFHVLKDVPLANISLLALPKHRVRLPRDAHRINDKAAWGLFTLLKFDIIRYNHMCK